MIEKMKFLSITGPKADIDRMTSQYLSKYEIQLENALSELKTVANLRPFTEPNPYKGELQTARELMESFQGNPVPNGRKQPSAPKNTVSGIPQKNVSLESALDIVRTLNQEMQELSAQKESLQEQCSQLKSSMDNIIPFADLNYDVSSILHFRHVKFRFGRIPHEYYDKFMKYIYDTVDTVIHKCQEDAQYVWVVYFVPEVLCDKIDAIYASMHFERFFLPDEYEGTPTEASHILEEKIDRLEGQIKEIDNRIAAAIDNRKEDLTAAFNRLSEYANSFDIMAELTCKSLDPEDVEAINKPQDYTSEAYGRVRADIQSSFSSSNGWNEGLYCVLNRVDPNKIIYSCLYLEDTIGAVYPLDYEYYGLEYEELYETGKQIRFDWIENTDGIWSYVLSPVFNEDGEVIAAMEVGTNLYAFQEANNAMIRTMIFNVVSIVAIMILIFTELSFLWFYREKAGRAAEARAAAGENMNEINRKLAVYIIRPMIFMIFMADCMATAFLPMLANQMAVPLWGIPAELMSAIPISTEVLLTAIFSFMGGFMLEKIGFRKMMIAGSILFTAGLTAVGCSASILPFIGAKAVIGIGVGLLLVSINTLVASYPPEESREGFSFYNSGSLAGLTVGTTVGSFLAVSLGYLNVYFVAAAVSLVVLIMILNIFKKDTVYPDLKAEEGEDGTGKISIVRFLFKKELIIFFACAMIPYLFCGYFLNYFLPLFAESQGMAETAIGQLFLINGICVIYLGPSLTSMLTGRLKLKYTVILAGAIYITTLFLFFLFTGNGMVVASAFLFGIADSFGFSALSIYFSSLDTVKLFGSGKAMGVYSTFENISQTLGPFVFSAVFVLGIKQGIFAITVVYLILLVLYTLFGKKIDKQ